MTRPHTPSAPPASPRHAVRKKAAVDRLLDPDLFKALSDPTRVKLLACVLKCGRACSVTEIAECCSVDFSVVARHLAVLARAGLVASQKEGRTVWYTPQSAALADRFREIAVAIDEWTPAACCGTSGHRSKRDSCC